MNDKRHSPVHVQRIIDYQKLVDELAQIAYKVMATETFGVPPSYLGKRNPAISGSPQQTQGVDWEQLPERAKRIWRMIVERIIAEYDSVE